MKLWGGRFETGPSEVFERFSGSLRFDRRLLKADIRGSQAFARALEHIRARHIGEGLVVLVVAVNAKAARMSVATRTGPTS